jgi:hypothetical protein
MISPRERDVVLRVRSRADYQLLRGGKVARDDFGAPDLSHNR